MGDVRTHYEVLGVPRDASTDEIRAAYLGKARAIHPDVVDPTAPQTGPPAEDMRVVNEAYQVLRDGRRRARYDADLRRSEPEPLPPRPDEDSFGDDDDHEHRPTTTEPLFTTDSLLIAALVRGWPIILLALVAAIFVFSAYATSDDDDPDPTGPGADEAGIAWELGDCLVRLPEPRPVPCGDEHDATVVAFALGDASCSETAGWFEADVPGPARLCIVYDR